MFKRRPMFLFLLLSLCWVSVSAAPIRITAMGDSITLGQTTVPSGQGLPGYRLPLWQLTQTLGVDIDFVGRYTSLFDAGFDQDHEALAGARVRDLLNIVATWDTGPDIVLLHIGFEDLVAKANLLDVLADLRALLKEMRAVNPNLIIFIGKLYPVTGAPVNYPYAPPLDTYLRFNALLDELVLQENSALSPVIAVDHSINFNPLLDLSEDGLQLTAAAASRMAQRWFDAMLATPAVQNLVNPDEIIPDSGVSRTETYALSGFKRLYIDEGFDLHVGSGNYLLNISAPDNWFTYLQVFQAGESLYLRRREGFQLTDKVRVDLRLPALNYVELSGTSTLNMLGLELETLQLVLNDSSQLRAESSVVQQLQVEGADASLLDLSTSAVSFADLQLSGAHQAQVRMNGVGALIGLGQEQSSLHLIGTPSSETFNLLHDATLSREDWDAGRVPIVAFTSSSPAPLTLQLDASGSFDPDGRIAQYTWLTSDGQTADGEIVTLVFSSAARYSITLTLTDQNGLRNSLQQIIDVAATPPPCTYSFSPETAAYPVQGGIGSIFIETPSHCTWSASSLAPDWLTIIQGSYGQGSGEVYYQLAANEAEASRDGLLRIADQDLRITQAGSAEAGCTYQVEPLTIEHDVNSGFGSIQITTVPDCAWTVQSHVDWLTILYTGENQGSLQIPYMISSNLRCDDPQIVCNADTSAPTAARSTYLDIAGQRVQLTQAGTVGDSACMYSISPPLAEFSANSGAGSIQINAPAGCAWTAESSASWLQVILGANGEGPGEVVYTVSENTCIAPACEPGDDNSRSTVLSIAGQGFPVYQAKTENPCRYTFTPAEVTHESIASGGLLQVDTGANCVWQAQSDVDWLRITAGQGQGSGQILYELEQNQLCVGAPCAYYPGPARVAAISLGDDSALIRQSSERPDCVYAVTPQQRAHTSNAGMGFIDIQTSADCVWVATSKADWISLDGDARGIGAGRLRYQVSANTSYCASEPCPAPAAARSGQIQISDRTVTVEQLAEPLQPVPEPEKPIYWPGETVRVTAPRQAINMARYLAVALPDHSAVYLLGGTNQFLPYDGTSLVAWPSSGAESQVLIDAVAEGLPAGEYWLYQLELPLGLEPMGKVDYWQLQINGFSLAR